MLCVTHDVPKILGYQNSSLFAIHKGSLCAISIDPESEKMKKETYLGLGFENEFVID